MGWSQAMSFRDCPWCGLREAQMNNLAANKQANAILGARHWSFVACPRCGGVVALEHGPGNQSEKEAKLAVPSEKQKSDVGHLPTNPPT